MGKVISVVGARPQFVKLGPLSSRLRALWTEVIVHTGQHYEEGMSDTFIRDLNLPSADYNLGVGSGRQGDQTGRMLASLERVYEDEQPDAVLVFGDTNSTLAGALAAAKLGITVVHIEAGLRSFNRDMPEEINRVAADHISDCLFAPTKTAMSNLRREGLEERAWLTGDIMVDALRENVSRALATSRVLSEFGLRAGSYNLLTLHRPYNVDDPASLQRILDVLARLGEEIVFPVHPRTREVMAEQGVRVGEGVRLCEPLGYLDFVCLQKSAKRVITDSGGIQKEAYLLGVACVTVRPETEWVETLEAGWNLLVDLSSPRCLQRIRSFAPQGEPMAIFGDNVAERMVEILRKIVPAGASA